MDQSPNKISGLNYLKYLSLCLQGEIIFVIMFL